MNAFVSPTYFKRENLHKNHNNQGRYSLIIVSFGKYIRWNRFNVSSFEIDLLVHLLQYFVALYLFFVVWTFRLLKEIKTNTIKNSLWKVSELKNNQLSPGNAKQWHWCRTKEEKKNIRKQNNKFDRKKSATLS